MNHVIKALSRALTGAFLSTCSVLADTLHVPDDYPTIQAGIDAALDGDEVVVAPGAYFEAINFLGKTIALRSSDGPEVTTIDGAGHLHVVQCVSSEGSDTVLDGFTITGGSANGEEFPDNIGGGMYNDASSPTVTNCSFVGNFAGGGGAGGTGSGGGMYNIDSSPMITNCSFIGNDVHVNQGSGGGMFNENSNPTVTNCMFSGNTSSRSGGGMENSSSSPTVTDCSFTGNEGGGMGNGDSDPTVTNCSFIGNSSGRGGGMENFESNPTVTNCSFIGNSSTADTHSPGGGGMFNRESNPTVTNCTFNSNEASGFGGGIMNLGGSPIMTNCTFTSNDARCDGGGMYNKFFSSPTVTNCTFSGNTATNGNGDALAFDSINQQSPSDLMMTNCILWDGGDEIWNNDGSTITICYTVVQGGWQGIGNIDADPMFVDPGTGDYRLSSGSPAIDAGNNDAVPRGVTTDLDDNPRFVDDPKTKDTGKGEAPIVDMGAYEFQVVAACAWDLDGDGNVGTGDLILLLGAWGDPYGTQDLIELLGNWGPCA